MNRKHLLVGLSALGLALTGSNALAVSDSFDVGATVTKPLAMNVTDGLYFGVLSVGTTGGTVVVDTNEIRSATGDVVLMSGGLIRDAEFDLTGDSNRALSVSIPSSIIITSGGGDTMTVDNFVHDVPTNLPTSNSYHARLR